MLTGVILYIHLLAFNINIKSIFIRKERIKGVKLLPIQQQINYSYLRSKYYVVFCSSVSSFDIVFNLQCVD